METEKVKQEEVFLVVALLKEEHKAEIKCLNDLLEYSHLQNDQAAQPESQLVKEWSGVATQLSQVKADVELRIKGFLSQTTYLEDELLKMSRELKQASQHLKKS